MQSPTPSVIMTGGYASEIRKINCQKYEIRTIYCCDYKKYDINVCLEKNNE